MRTDNWTEVSIAGGNPFPQQPTKFVYNRTGGATVKYNVYQFDTIWTAALETVPNAAGVLLPAVADMGDGPSGAFGNIVTPYATSTVVAAGGSTPDALVAQNGCYCIAVAVAADNELCEVMVVGKTFLNATTTGMTAAPGTVKPWRRLMVGDNTSVGIVAGGTGVNTAKVIGVTIATASWSASETAVAVEVYINGINGAYCK